MEAKSNTMDTLSKVLDDSAIIRYLLKNITSMSKIFQRPRRYGSIKPPPKDCQWQNGKALRLPVHWFWHKECSSCSSKLAIKKVVPATLYDDVLGKIPVGIITKYCRPRKLTFYRGYVESYESKVHIYEDDWEKYGIFQSTSTSCLTSARKRCEMSPFK